MKSMKKILAVLLIVGLLPSCGGEESLETVALLSATSLEVKMGEKADLDVMNYNGEINWTSSNTGIATVDDEGVIKPISIGGVAISATLEDGSTMNCVVEVLPGESNVEKITVTSYYSEADDITVDYSSETYVRLSASCAPVDPMESLTWSSSDETLATVSGDGVATARGNGIVKITATALNGVSGSCTLRIKNVPKEIEEQSKLLASNVPIVSLSEGQSSLTAAVPVQSVTAKSGVILNEHKLYLSVGDYVKLDYIVSNAADSTVKWMSTDKSIATAKDSYVVAVGEGLATVSVVTCDGAVASCRVAVGKDAIAELKNEK